MDNSADVAIVLGHKGDVGFFGGSGAELAPPRRLHSSTLTHLAEAIEARRVEPRRSKRKDG